MLYKYKTCVLVRRATAGQVIHSVISCAGGSREAEIWAIKECTSLSFVYCTCISFLTFSCCIESKRSEKQKRKLHCITCFRGTWRRLVGSVRWSDVSNCCVYSKKVAVGWRRYSTYLYTDPTRSGGRRPVWRKVDQSTGACLRGGRTTDLEFLSEVLDSTSDVLHLVGSVAVLNKNLPLECAESANTSARSC